MIMKTHLPLIFLCLLFPLTALTYAQVPEACAFSYGTYSEAAPMPLPSYTSASGMIDGKIYLTCGDMQQGDTYTPRTQLQVYDLVTDTWDTTGAHIPFYRGVNAHNQSVADGMLYVIGGSTWISAGDDWEYIPYARVDAYDPETDTWVSKANLPLPLGMYGLCSMDGKLYIGGGMSTDFTNLTGFYEYDPLTDQWKALADMQTARNSPSFVAFEGKMYVFGGGTGGGGSTVSCEVYDPGTNQWSDIAPLPGERTFGAACEMYGDIYYFGGRTSGGNLETTKKQIYRYDPVADHWTHVDDLPQANAQMNLSKHDHTIYIIGGRTPGRQTYPEVYTYDISKIKLDVPISVETVGIDPVQVDLSEHFSHVDGGEITYSVCLDEGIVDASVNGSMLTLTGLANGDVEVHILAQSGEDRMGEVIQVNVLIDGIEEFCREAASLHVYPNPANGIATLAYSIQSPGWVRLEIYDLMGKRVAVPLDVHLGTGEFEYQLDTGGLVPGIYLCNLTTADDRTMVKLVVEH